MPLRLPFVASLLLCLVACPDRGSRLKGSFGTVTETFEQKKASRPLDVLFVVDNSRSMGPTQEKVGQNLGVFFDWINKAGVDYQIAVTSTDAVGVLGDRPAPRGRFSSLGGAAIVRPTTPNATQVLAANIALGTDGTNNEQPIFTAMQALGLTKFQRGAPPPSNAGFLRPNARLGIIFVSDEDDFSTIANNELLGALRDLKGIGNHDAVFFGGVIFDGFDLNPLWKPAHPERIPSRTCMTSTADQRPSSEVLTLLGMAHHPSTLVSICGEFAPALRKMAIDAAGFETRFRLSQQADPLLTVECDGQQMGAFCVRVAGAVVPATSYTYDAATNQIVFEGDYVPPIGSTMTVDFAVQTVFKREQDQTLGEVTSCMQDGDCPAGIRCAEGRCVLKCKQPDHCRQGFTCSEQGSCRCSADSSCKAGDVCTPSGACQPTPRCTNSASCAVGQFCEPVTGACRPLGECRIPTGVAEGWDKALGSLSCPRGQVCDGAACRAGCVDDFGCGPSETCRKTGTELYGACVRGCQASYDCCIGQRCDVGTGRCVAVPGTVGGGAVIPLCDKASCLNSSRCENAGGSCVSLFDSDYGCVPPCTQDSQCAKGYSCTFPRVVTTTNRCTLGGAQCTGGRLCSASTESPMGSCTCLSDADCDSSATCREVSAGRKFCLSRAGVCGPQYECGQLRSGEQLVCNDSF